jgi:hypothetical protein
MGVRMMTAITEIEFVMVCSLVGTVLWLGAVYVGAV